MPRAAAITVAADRPLRDVAAIMVALRAVLPEPRVLVMSPLGAGDEGLAREARLEAAIDEVRPKIRRALEELDAKVDEAVADIRPKAQNAMDEVRPLPA